MIDINMFMCTIYTFINNIINYVYANELSSMKITRVWIKIGSALEEEILEDEKEDEKNVFLHYLKITIFLINKKHINKQRSIYNRR